GDAIADHPALLRIMAGVGGEGGFEKSWGGLAAGAFVLGPVQAQVRGEDAAASGAGAGEDGLVGGLEVGAGGLALGPGGLVGDDAQPEPGAGEAGQRLGDAGVYLH